MSSSRSFVRLWLCVAVASLGMAALCWADDPVEQLRKSLKDARWDLVGKDVERLKTLNELRRGYFSEWPPNLEDVDQKKFLDKLRAGIGDKLADKVNKAALAKDIDREIAACILIAELGEYEQPDQRSPGGKYASRFTGILVGTKGEKGLVDHPDVRVRQAALHALGKITPPPALAMPALRTVLKQDELGPRRIAAYALGDLVKNAAFRSRPDEMATLNQAVAEAVALLGVANQDELIRGYSMQAILTSAKTFTEHRWTTRFEAADDPLQFEIDNKTVEASVRELLKSYRTAMPRFVASLETDPSVNIKLTALEAINQLIMSRYKITERLQAKHGKTLLPRSELLHTFGAADPIEPLLNGDWIAIPRVLKREEDVRLKRGVMSLLERVAEDIDANLDTKKQEKKISADTLRQFVKAITPALSDPDRYVRWTAARTLRYLSPEYFDEEVILALGQMLIDPEQRDPDLSGAAATTLQEIASAPYAARAIRYLRSAIADPNMDSKNRVGSMKALVAIGGKSANDAYPELTGAVSDADPVVRREACQTLGQLGHPATEEAYRAAHAALRMALRDDDTEVRLNASEAILSITPPR